jgi:selT/selW/selH-like putative selenoprotein
MALTIEYCITCNYRSMAASLAMNVKAATGISSELSGSNKIGAFEVFLDGKLVFSKLQTNSFPDHQDIIAIIKDSDVGQP